jgi:CheY-like chemotaxis protein
MPHVVDVFPTFKLRAARTSRQALELALDRPPLLIIARLDAPDLDGLELMTLARSNRDLRDTEVLFTATRVTADERRELDDLGVYAVILHPIAGHELASALQRLKSKWAEG